MSVIRIGSVTKRYGRHTVLHNVSLRVGKGERLSVVGRNGSGKTTLLRLISGAEEPDSGTVEVDAGLSVESFSQFTELGGDSSIEEVLDREFKAIHDLAGALDAIGAEIDAAGPAGGGADGGSGGERRLRELIRRQTEMLAEMERLGGWNYGHRIETVLTRLGFVGGHRSLPLSGLSGGWRNRAGLALMLLRDPDVILLDEPTNYLDAEGVEWLTEWVSKGKATVVAVSHDRSFLDGVSDRMVELENNRIYEYVGGYAAYVRQRRIRGGELGRDFVHEEELLAMEENAINDRAELAKALKASRAGKGGLGRRIADIKKKVTPPPSGTIVTSLYQGMKVPDMTLGVSGLAVGYGGEPVIKGVGFDLYGGERMAIVGRNGCGKTTLIKALLGLVAPSAGKVAWGGGVKHAYFNGVLEGLDPDDTVTHNVNVHGDAYGAPRKAVNRFIRMFGFSEASLGDRIGDLSGGQRARVAVIKCMISGCNAIVMDEPTNHLDIPSIQAMEYGLVSFPGSVLFASHDAFFIDKVATRVLVYEGGSFEGYGGNLTAYRNRPT